MWKAVFMLVIFVAVGALFATGAFKGEGFFKFGDRADAEKVIADGQALNDAMDASALNSENGEVNFGDPDHPDPAQRLALFHYLYSDELIPNTVGPGNDPDDPNDNPLVDDWVLNADRTEVFAVVKNSDVCRYINEHKNGVEFNADEDIPECGTEEGDSVSCCFSPDL